VDKADEYDFVIEMHHLVLRRPSTVQLLIPLRGHEALAEAVEVGRWTRATILSQDLHRRIGDLPHRTTRIPSATESADRRFGRAVQLEHVVEPEPIDEFVDVGWSRAVANAVTKRVLRILSDFLTDPTDVDHEDPRTGLVEYALQGIAQETCVDAE
jgi:hypothetical protein